MVKQIETCSNDNRYKIHPTKSAILRYNAKKEITNTSLHGEIIDNAEQTVHLEVTRKADGKVNIEEKVQLGRRTVYSLMGLDVMEKLE